MSSIGGGGAVAPGSIGLGELAPPGLDPAEFLFTGGVWTYVAPGGASASGHEVAAYVDFDFNTPATITLLNGALANGDKIIRTEIKIITPFNDATATATVGTTGSPALLLGTTDSCLELASTFGSDVNEDISAPDALQLTLSPGASTAGAGQVMVTIRKA